MSRFVLRFAGAMAPQAHTERIRSSPKVRVIDDSPKMLLVEGTDADVRELIAGLSDWKVLPERSIRIPDTRPKLRKSAR